MHITERIEPNDHRGDDQVTEPDVPGGGAFAPLPSGTRIGRYVIAETVAVGGFGIVYRARPEHGGTRDFALKVLHADLTQEVSAIRRFELEVDVMRRVRHPCVVRIFDVGTSADGQPFFSMEFLHGETLEAWIRRLGPCSPETACQLLEGVCSALDQAHALSIVHRDIKASNVMVCEDEGARRVVLLDFGVAKLLDAAGPGLTNSRVVMGTPSCMAPEQIEGGKTEARTDVYALGALLYFMLTGEPAFFDPSPIVTMHLHLRARPPLASAVAPVSAAVDEVILRALHKSPGDRFASAGAFFNALRGAVQGSAGARGTRRTERALWLTVDVGTVRDEPGTDGDELLFDDIENVLSIAANHASERQLTPVFQSGNNAVFVLAYAASAGKSSLRWEMVCAALRLRDDIEARTAKQIGVDVHIAVYDADAVYEGDRVVDGTPLHASQDILAADTGIALEMHGASLDGHFADVEAKAVGDGRWHIRRGRV